MLYYSAGSKPEERRAVLFRALFYILIKCVVAAGIGLKADIRGTRSDFYSGKWQYDYASRIGRVKKTSLENRFGANMSMRSRVMRDLPFGQTNKQTNRQTNILAKMQILASNKPPNEHTCKYADRWVSARNT